MQAKDWGEIFAMFVSNKGLLPTTFKEVLQYDKYNAIKTTVREDFTTTTTSMTKTEKADNAKWQQRCGDIVYGWWEHKMVPVLYKTAWQSHLDTYPRYESMYSQKQTYTGMLFHKAPIQKQPKHPSKVKDKPIVAYLYNPILFSNKKKQNIDIHKDTNEPQKHPAEQKQADTKDYTL